MFIGGMFTIPSHGWFMALFYPHYIQYRFLSCKNSEAPWLSLQPHSVRYLDFDGPLLNVSCSWGYHHQSRHCKTVSYPLVNFYITMERSSIFKFGKSPISMAMFSSTVSHYQRVFFRTGWAAISVAFPIGFPHWVTLVNHVRQASGDCSIARVVQFPGQPDGLWGVENTVVTRGFFVGIRFF